MAHQWLCNPKEILLGPACWKTNKHHRASLVAQMVIESACSAGDTVWSLGWEDPLEKEMATHSSILPWRILWTEEPGRLPSWSPRVRHNWSTNTSLHCWKMAFCLVPELTCLQIKEKSISGKANMCFLHDWRLIQWNWKASCSCNVLLKALDRS